MPAIAVFAGSFSPFTKGHEDIVQKVLPLFDKIFIAIGHNYNKKDAFSVEQRMKWIQNLYVGNPKVEVLAYEGLTVDLCRKVGAARSNWLMDRQLAPELETVLLPASPQWAAVSSTLVRELWQLGADYSPFVSYKLPELKP